jgi:Rhodanese-like domain
MRYYISLIAIAFIGISILAACQQNAPTTNTSKANTAQTNTAKTNSAATPASADPADSAPRITLADAKKAFDEGNVVFVDTRAEVSYKQEHLKGAINVPAEAMETRYKEIPTGKKIIAYCS